MNDPESATIQRANEGAAPQAACVVFATDENYAAPTGVAIRSLVENFAPSRDLEIIVFETGLSGHARDKLEACARIRPDVTLSFVDVGSFLSMKRSKFYTGGNPNLSVAAYYRLYAPAVLPERDSILYLDSDLVVLHDVSPLLDAIGEDDWLAACADFVGMAQYAISPNVRGYMQKTLKVDDAGRFFNSGVLVMNLAAMRRDNVQEKFEAALRAIKAPRLHDQDILNFVCKERVRLLDHAWNYAGWCENAGDFDFARNLPPARFEEFQNASRAPKIVHYNGFGKPWHYPERALADIFWEYARKTPFYEQLLIGMTQHQLQEYKKSNSIVSVSDALLCLRKNVIVRKYRMYRVLALFTAGNLKRHFIKLGNKFKAQATRVRELETMLKKR